MRIGTIGLAVCGLAAMLAAGCTSQPGPQPAPGTQTEAGQAKQPYDVILGEKIGLIEYAAQRIRNKCLADAGYPQNLATMAARRRTPTTSSPCQRAISARPARRRRAGWASARTPVRRRRAW